MPGERRQLNCSTSWTLWKYRGSCRGASGKPMCWRKRAECWSAWKRAVLPDIYLGRLASGRRNSKMWHRKDQAFAPMHSSEVIQLPRRDFSKVMFLFVSYFQRYSLGGLSFFVVWHVSTKFVTGTAFLENLRWELRPSNLRLTERTSRIRRKIITGLRVGFQKWYFLCIGSLLTYCSFFLNL